MTTARARVERTTELAAPPEAVWPHVADVRGIADLMESLEDYEHLGDDQYRFRLRSYAALGHRFVPEARLAVRWRAPREVTFTPVGETTQQAHADGRLALVGHAPDRTDVRLSLDIALRLPIPGLLAAPAAAVLRHELKVGFDRFLGRLRERAAHP